VTYGAAQAPLLAVVGGPTGAGKSTLLNSLVRAPVSAAGVLRPTTRQPVLVCNPRDWATVRRHGLRPICAPLMPEGIALVDAPDADSIGETNRAATDEVLAAADLWLYVTTASRYADATAWRQLRAARERQVALGIILDRAPAGFALDIVGHLRELLGPPEPPLFLIPEARLDRQGMLPDELVAPLRGWLAAVVAGPPVQPRPELTPAGHEIRPAQPAAGVIEVRAGGMRDTEPATPGDDDPVTGPASIDAGDRPDEGTGAQTAGQQGVVQSSTSHGQPDGRPEGASADIPQGADVGETVKL
jgi:hypothetical protein